MKRFKTILRICQILTCILISSISNVLCQNGSIQGKIIDKATKEGIPFATVVIEYGGKQYGGSTADIDGFYSIKPLPFGTYDLKATYIGYITCVIHNVLIQNNITDLI